MYTLRPAPLLAALCLLLTACPADPSPPDADQGADAGYDLIDAHDLPDAPLEPDTSEMTDMPVIPISPCLDIDCGEHGRCVPEPIPGGARCDCDEGFIEESLRCVERPPALLVTQLSAGANHTCAVIDDALRCWGGNSSYQLGTNARQDTHKLQPPVLVGAISALSSGEGYSCAIHNGGELSCWGNNSYGQLGPDAMSSGLSAKSAIPLRIALDRVSAVSSGAKHTCAIHDGGKLSCWGGNAQGQLGVDPTITPWTNEPVQVFAANVEAVSLAGETTCAIHDSGKLSCWGNNSAHQLGPESRRGTSEHRPRLLFDTGISAVQLGPNHSCVLRDAALFCWGDNTHGELGVAPGSPTPTPTRVPLNGVSAFALTASSTCAIHGAGELSCWGSNADGMLAIEYTISATQFPNRLFEHNTTQLTAGPTHVCALHEGKIKCWGVNRYGQLGVAPLERHELQRGELNPSTALAAPVEAVSAGARHTCAIHDGGELSCWGSNIFNQLGVATNSQRQEPVIEPAHVFSRAIDVQAGAFHTCAIHDYGALSCWGRNDYGQLGISSSQESQHRPQKVFFSGVTQVSAAQDTTCAIHDGGKLSCWGSNLSGHLMAPSTTSARSPQLLFDGEVSLIATSPTHSCAVHAGQLKCWGSNQHGQLGSALNAGLPTINIEPQVIALSDVGSVALGRNHSCALGADQSLMCWGSNYYGQLGVMTNLKTLQPNIAPLRATPSRVQLPQSIYSKNFSTCAIHDGGKLSCWGNNSGQLGATPDSDTTRNPSLLFLSGTSTASMGNAHTCAIHEGALKCWGDNTYQQLGPGSPLRLYSSNIPREIDLTP